MKITIDEDVVRSTSTEDGVTLTMPEVIACILTELSDTGHNVIDDLVDRGILVYENDLYTKRIRPFVKYKKLIRRILLSSDNSIPKDSELIPLAQKLKAIYPTGKKNSQYWQDSLSAIVDRLKGLYRHFPEIKKYSYEDIVNATQKYIDSFGTDRTYMKTLSYFLWKKKEESVTSELLMVLENPEAAKQSYYDDVELI
jgi:hypothetical protein